MSIEEAIVTLLGPLFPSRIWPDTPPDGFSRLLPFAVFQDVGGKESWYVDQTTAPSHRHSRIQFKVYAPTRLQANALIKQVGDALRASNWVVSPEGGPISDYISGLKQYESRQDFGIWHPVSP